MSQATSIEWTDFSVNPFRARGAAGTPYEGHVGEYCEKVSPGCTNCYASKMQRRFRMPEFDHRHKKQVELYLDGLKLLDVLKRRKPTKYFWCDMTDMFGEFYPDEWIDQVVATCAMTPHHTHQFLTKRIDRAKQYFYSRLEREWHGPNGTIVKLPFDNLWLGTSVENQATADERIPILLQTPAMLRWISAEPLLGAVSLQRFDADYLRGHKLIHETRINAAGSSDDGLYMHQGFPKLDWVVVGGESGTRARTFDIQWARTIIAQCKTAGVPCFVKQLGSQPHDLSDPTNIYLNITNYKGGDMSEWPEDLRVREFPGGAV